MAVDCVNPISHLFDSQLRSRLQCLDCGHSSSSTDLFTMLQLPIPIDDRSLVTIIGYLINLLWNTKYINCLSNRPIKEVFIHGPKRNES
jgi:ubiquitin C-terminal hydrolase